MDRSSANAMNTPLISVIIPARQSGGTVEAAIRSILKQTYAHTEILVIDDHSTDNTETVTRALSHEDSRISYHRLPFDDPHRYDSRLKKNINAGYAARNYGFDLAQGEYITFQDADDVSLLNRLEIQYNLLQAHNAIHFTLGWIPYQESLKGRSINADLYIAKHQPKLWKPEDLYRLSQKTKGLVAKICPRINTGVPFYLKRLKFVHRCFFGALDPYPGAGNSPLFHKDVVQRVRFRPLRERVWPSFMGRGADRDFNFQVAETFRNSYILEIPAYLWDTRSATDVDQNTIESLLC